MKERVHPELLADLENFGDLELNKDYLSAVREGMAANKVEAELPEAIEVKKETVIGVDQNEIKLKVYTPKNQSTSLPALLWIHGGGYVIGDYEENDLLCAAFVQQANCVVVSVDYRLSPDASYPGPLEDCYTALKWMADHADILKIDTNRIGIAGASAGGGLTAGLSLLARDRNYPKLSFQMPLYPMINDKNNTPSNNEIKEGMVWNQKLNKFGWEMYLGALSGSDDIPIYAAPARAEDFSNLPPTYTCVGQLDPFRSETLDYVTKLAEAGVDVEFHLYPGAFHGFDLISGSNYSQNAVQEYINAVKNGLNK